MNIVLTNPQETKLGDINSNVMKFIYRISLLKLDLNDNDERRMPNVCFLIKITL